MRFVLIVGLIIFGIGHVSALTVEEVLQKVQDTQQNAKTAAYNCSYELYKGHSSSSVHTSYTGSFYRNGDQIYQKINNTEFVYANNYFLQISHDENAMVLGKAQTIPSQDTDIKAILKNCIGKSMEDKDGYYAITLNYGNLATNPFSIVKLRVDKTSYGIQQLDLFYRLSRDFSLVSSKAEMEQPHLKIKFKPTTVSGDLKASCFEMGTYLSKNNTLLIPTGNCKGYELIDNRIK